MVISRKLRVNQQRKEKRPAAGANGPLSVVRVRYRLRPSGDSSRASEIRFMAGNVAQVIEMGSEPNFVPDHGAPEASLS
jgi:hypothetical protein